MNKMFFTEEEANELIPAIERELASLKSVTKAFSEHYDQIEQHKKTLLYRHKTKADEDILFKKESRMEFMEFEAQTFVRNILSMGVNIIDIENGVLTFPSIKEGKEIELYWQDGDKVVSLMPKESESEPELMKEDD